MYTYMYVRTYMIICVYVDIYWTCVAGIEGLSSLPDSAISSIREE